MMKECGKCSRLEKKLAETAKKANEAQDRMNSIAKILCLGNFDSNSSEKRNTALSIVSQMLLDSSPKRKRRCIQSKNSPSKENVLLPASMDTFTEIANEKVEAMEGAVGGVIPDTIAHSPLKLITNLASATSPPKKHSQNSPTHKSGLSSSINLPVSCNRISSVKKNLSADCIEYSADNEVIETSPMYTKKKGLSFNINLENVGVNKNIKNTAAVSDTTLDATLLEYVKDTRTELDKIWFDDDPDGTVLQQKNELTPLTKENSKTSSAVNEIIEETPSRNEDNKNETKKRADFWLLKEKRELCGKSRSLDGKKLRQTKLELGVRQKAVDISTLAGFNGGIQQQQDVDKDEDIIPGSPSSQICGEAPSRSNILGDINTLVGPADFRPVASSTQWSTDDENLDSKRATSIKPQDFVYKRDAIKKKGERAKLPGWDCYECCKYYNAMALSPATLKERKNACSRHRDKFKPKHNETPPGFWNPLFPDTQECKEKGMYVSVHCPTSDT